MQRMAEKQDIESLDAGHKFYNPMENKEINDKENADYEGLAERIVKHDTDAIDWSDTVVIEPLAEACGTMVELGQIKGMKDVSLAGYKTLTSALPDQEKLQMLAELFERNIDRKVYPHFEDVRRVDGLTETGDRRSLGINQYVYGVCLDLTGGKGFYEWSEVLKELSSE